VSLLLIKSSGYFYQKKNPEKNRNTPKKIGMRTFYDDYHNKLNISSGNSCWTLDIFRLKWTIEICDTILCAVNCIDRLAVGKYKVKA